MHLDQLPGHWQLALQDIAGNRRSPWTGVICLPGGERTALQLIDFGAVEFVGRRRRHVTLTPWGAQALLDVELFEREEGGRPTWLRSALVREALAESPLVSRGFRDVATTGRMHLNPEGFTRTWYEDADPAEPPPPIEPVLNDYGTVVALFAGDEPEGRGPSPVVLYRDAEIRREAKAKADARRAKQRRAKAAKRKYTPEEVERRKSGTEGERRTA